MPCIHCGAKAEKILLSFGLCFSIAMTAGCNAGNSEQQSIGQPSTEQQSSAEQQRMEEFMYTFKPCSPDLLPERRSNIRNIYDGKKAECHSLFIGQVLNLFGEPDYTTEDNEDLYSKAVCAEDKEGNVIYFEVYYGPSGPAIGGADSRDEVIRKAADELAEVIMAAEPKDFEYKSVYEDLGVTVRMGVKDGKPYYESDVPEDLF